jgi:hypothetical protein
MMVEIDFDDVVGRIEDDQIAGTMPNPAMFVSDVIGTTKSENPDLAFGVTIYEDGLRPCGADKPAGVAARADLICASVCALRGRCAEFRSNVATAKNIFPNAKIIAGAHPYDRINYLPLYL